MADRRTPKRKNEAEPRASTAKKARGTSVASRSSSVAESHDDATQTTNLDAHGAEVHWEWENEEEVITRTTITEDRIISLRSKTISTPIQRSVLAVSHIYTHGRQLHDGDIGRLVNADEDEVLEIDSDQESEISTPARRLYQRGSMGGSGRSTRSETAPARRSSRARTENDAASDSGLQSLEYVSGTSRSSRRSTSGRTTNAANGSSSSASVNATSSSSTSTRRTSSAATTAALTIAATPLGRRRSARGSVSNASSTASTPVASRQASPTVPASPLRSNDSVVLAPAALAFNQQNEEYNAPEDHYDEPDEPYVPYQHPHEVVNEVEEEEESVWDKVVRVVAAVAQHYLKSLLVVVLVVVVCIVVVYLRTARIVPPTHISPTIGTFKHDYKHTTSNVTTSNTTLLLQQQLEAQRVELEAINSQLQHTKLAWDNVVSSAEEVVEEVNAVQSSVIEALHVFDSDVALLDAHLHTLHTQANATTTTLHTTLEGLKANDTIDNDAFTSQLSALAPKVADLTQQANELDVLVNSGVSVLQSIVDAFPNANTTYTDLNADVSISLEDVISLARVTEAHLAAVNADKHTNNTILNTTVTATARSVEEAQHTLRAIQDEYRAAHESANQQVVEALKVRDLEQQASIERARQSVEAAVRATEADHALRAQYAAQAAAQEAARREQEEYELSQVPTFNVLNPEQAAGIVRDTAAPVVRATTAPLLATLTEQVSSGVEDAYDSVIEQNRVHNIDTVASDVVQGQAKHRNLAAKSKHDAILQHKHAATAYADADADNDVDTTSNTTLPLHDYAVAPRGGKVVHHRKTLNPIRNMINDHTLTSAPYKPSGTSGGMLSAWSGKHRGNKGHKTFPRVVPHANEVISHHKPSIDRFYPLPMRNHGSDSVVTSHTVRSDGKSSSVHSAGQMTVLLMVPVRVQSVKIVHATKNSTGSGSVDSPLQPCAPYRVRIQGWQMDPTQREARSSVDLGVYDFDSYSVSTSYLLSESSGEGTAVYEQEFDVAGHVRRSSSGSNSGDTVLRAVTLQVLSNHGEEEFSCVHRIQVIGSLVSDE